MSQKVKKILFVRQGDKSFFDTDLEILRGFSEVHDLNNYPPSFAKLPLLTKEILGCDLIYIWFMGRHAVAPLLLAKLFGKKVILVAGGWDVANCQEINYGLMRRRPLACLIKFLFKLSDRVLAVSESNQAETIQNAGIPTSKIRMIYHGFKPQPQKAEKQKMAVTVGVINKSNLKRKGLEDFVGVAAKMPQIPFVLIGAWEEEDAVQHLKQISTSNVRLTGSVDAATLQDYLSKAQVYIQLSYHEAFGCAVAEAMLQECVPVVSNRYSLPEVVGNAGYLVSYGDIMKAAETVKKALDDKDTGKRARQRVSEKFSFESRRSQIKNVIEDIFHEK